MLRPWNYHIELDLDSPITIHQQLVNHFQTLMRQGSWLSGSPLPSTRDLAKNLGINRKTVAKVYDELSAQGWIYTEPKRGTFVADILPNPSTAITTPAKLHASIEIQSPSEHTLKITHFLQKEMIRLTRRAALYMYRIGYEKNETADAGGLISLRELISQLLIYELRLNTNPASILCHHNAQILFQAFITQLKTRGDYILIDEACAIEDKNTLRDQGFTLIEVPSQNHDETPIFKSKNSPASNHSVSKKLTRTFSLDVIEKYCINYPIAALWLTAKTENADGQVLTLNGLVKTRLQQFNVLLVEDYRKCLISSQSPVSGKYLTENTVILSSLYAQRHPHIDIHYICLPPSLATQTQAYLNAYTEPQSLLNAQIQYEFIKCGHYKKLCLAWDSLFTHRYNTLIALLQSAKANTHINTHPSTLNIRIISEQAIYFNHSNKIPFSTSSDWHRLGIQMDYLKIEMVDNHTSRLNYQALDETTFRQFYADLKNALKNAYVPKELFLKAG